MNMNGMETSASAYTAAQASAHYQQEIMVTSTMPTILCCLCALPIAPNPSNMCVNCLQSNVDISSDILKNITIFQCKNCFRYQRPPYVALEWESREMLAFLLKKLKNLSKVRLVDANFVYTESHSKRIKIKLTIQKELFANAIIQQSFIVEFVIASQQCTDCQASFTEHTWMTCVQLRQKNSNKKSLFYLEQILLKHALFATILSVRSITDGLDFYFSHRSHSSHFIEFVRSHLPLYVKHSKKLISQDDNNNTYKYKFTTLVELPYLSKSDLFILPEVLMNSFGRPFPLLLVVKITSHIIAVDVHSWRVIEITSDEYWRAPMRPLMMSKNLTEYLIMDAEPFSDTSAHSTASQTAIYSTTFSSSVYASKVSLVRLTLTKCDDPTMKEYECVSYLGHILNPGDKVWAYDVSNANFDDEEIFAKHKHKLPEIIVVKKSFSRKNRAKRRKFMLKKVIEEPVLSDKKKVAKHEDDEMEEFLQEIEEDPELQTKINLYRRDDVDDVVNPEQMDSDADDEDLPQINMDSLLHSMEALEMDDGRKPVNMNSNTNDDDDFGDDYPTQVEHATDQSAASPDTSSSNSKNRRRKR